MLVSKRIADQTGVWVDNRTGTLHSRLTRRNAMRAARHPLRALSRLWKLSRAEPRGKALRSRVSLSREECLTFFEERQREAAYHDELFAAHPKLTVYYEDLIHHRRRTLDEIQTFLGLRPQALIPTTRRQNPEPLRELVAGYDDLREALRDTEYAAFFD
jgi:hypothetical protein